MSLWVCRVCGKEIHAMIRRGTGICSGNCEKEARDEH